LTESNEVQKVTLMRRPGR